MRSAEQLSRLRWRSRRGLLENDIFLSRFLHNPALSLSDDDLDALAFLLDLSDPDLLPLLSGSRTVSTQICPDPQLHEAITQLLIRIRKIGSETHPQTVT